MQSFSIDGSFFESLKTGKLFFVQKTEMSNALRYRGNWVECCEVEDGTLSDLRTWEIGDLVEAVLPEPKVELKITIRTSDISDVRGDKFGPCAIYSCQRPLSGWYNNESGKYVCARCAAQGNLKPKGLSFEKDHGFKMYTPGGPGRKID